ncbi:MAG: ferritin [Eubacteriaceae bacterium]|nr:ferritin [Eubacteriaceae bacterium]
MLSDKLTKALSDQVIAEYYSAYLYLAMAAVVDRMGLKGTANWLYVQAQEEMAHGTHMFEYILNRGATPAFAAIDQPPADYPDINEVFKKVLSHEEMVTKRINALATIAMEEFDHACYQFMMWYVDEQVEEESNAKEILDKLKLIGDNTGLLLTLDNEFASRVFVNPFPPQV